MTNSQRIVAACVASFLAGAPAFAHHSIVYFDRTQIIEGEGEITEVYWGNPHIKFTVTAADAGNAPQIWEIETSSVRNANRFGLTADLLATGTHVRIAGNPSSVLENRVLLTNMLLSNGQEILFGDGESYRPRWPGQRISEDTSADIGPAEAF